ncbi:unnamed protein product [Haemonchus placei]|uniref:Dihydroorotate dehydrogenase (quinone), mitochondrial n=1 Tax=Haemonchus placei TaxID=6290 RepID=A0A0N4WPH8_HAEPC|nr:unnamed protein product [Haemonchus placei]
MFSRSPKGSFIKYSVFIVGGGLLAYGSAESLASSETFYNKAVIPLIHRHIDGETAHDCAIRFISWGLLPRFSNSRKEYPELNCEFLGKQLKNPIGLAAGFDKNGQAIRPLAEWSGFGLIEIGTVTPIPQQGNPRPRVFRLLEDEALINRYGFNNDGVGRVQQRVKAARDDWNDNLAMFGVNLGKNKLCDEARLDYEIGVNYFAAYSDYVVINVSSPNTPGLRSIQKKSDLQNLLAYVKHAIDVMELNVRPKVLLKIAPDLTECEKKDIAQVVMDSKYGVDGLIVSNTTIARPDTLRSKNKDESGGLSGTPLREMSTECVRDMYRFTNGRVPIVGCGGVSSGADAYEKIRAGASVVQLYSALAYHGFPVVGKIKRELAELLRRDGYTNISQAVGADHRI